MTRVRGCYHGIPTVNAPEVGEVCGSKFLTTQAQDLEDAATQLREVISELDERKRQLVKEVEAQQVIQRASDEFFDFMEKRFMLMVEENGRFD